VEGVRLVNPTLPEITIYTDRGVVFIPPSGQVAGVSVTSIEVSRTLETILLVIPEPTICRVFKETGNTDTNHF